MRFPSITLQKLNIHRFLSGLFSPVFVWVRKLRRELTPLPQFCRRGVCKRFDVSFCLVFDRSRVGASEHLGVEGDDVVERHIARVARCAYVGEGLFGQARNVAFLNAEVAQMLRYLHFHCKCPHGLASRP